MDVYRQQLVNETIELAERLGKLSTFIYSAAFVKIQAPEQDRLSRQEVAMRLYLDVLHERLAASRPTVG